MREKRIQAIAGIDKERQATPAYLKEERKAVMEELNRTPETLLKERRVTMVEVMGNRIVEKAIILSKGLIDHFFIRMLQLLRITVLALSIIGFGYCPYAIRRIVQSRQPTCRRNDARFAVPLP